MELEQKFLKMKFMFLHLINGFNLKRKRRILEKAKNIKIGECVYLKEIISNVKYAEK